jgi:hypothetical protein
MLKNNLQHTLSIRERVVVPKSQHDKLLAAKPIIPHRIFFSLIGMLAAIQLNNQTVFEANEIDNIGTNRHLPPELVALQPSIPEQIPKRPLGIRHPGP